jgi:hypothetical protein
MIRYPEPGRARPCQTSTAWPRLGQAQAGRSPRLVTVRLGLGAAALAATLCGARAARAEVVVGIEPRAELVIADPPRFGPGLVTMLGYSLDLYPLLLAPELELGGSIFPGEGWFGDLRAMGGLRVGLTAQVEPSIYVHAGYGFVGSNAALAHGFAIDAGATLDGRLSRELTLGGSLGYQGIVAGGSSIHAIVLGAHVGVWF